MDQFGTYLFRVDWSAFLIYLQKLSYAFKEVVKIETDLSNFMFLHLLFDNI